MLDRDIARGEIDQAPWDEERAHPPWPLLGEEERCFFDALQSADARANQHAGPDLILVSGRLPAGVGERLLGRAHRIDDKVIDLALLFRLHPIVWIEGAVAAVAARDLAGDLAGEIGDVEILDALGGILAGGQPLPGDFHAAAQRRKKTKTCDDDTSHLTLSRDPR